VRKGASKLNISPLDVRNQIFKRKFRGYDPEEVRLFLDSMADSIEGLLKEKEKLEQEVSALRERIEAFGKMEATLRDAMITAQRVCDEARANAEREAKNIIREAELEAEQKLSEAKRSVDELERVRSDALSRTLAMVAQLRSLFESQLTFLGTLEDQLRKENVVEGRGVRVCEGSQP